MHRVWTLLLCLCTTPLFSEPLAKVQVHAVQPETLFDTYQYPVIVEAQQESNLHAEIAGTVKSLPIQLGSTVQAGQPLLILQHSKVEYSQAPFVVKSPISGQVAAVYKKVGARVEIGELLAHIVNREYVALKIEIPETELSQLAIGLLGTLSFRTAEGPLSQVRLQGIAPRIDPTTGTATAELQWDKTQWTPETPKKVAQLYPGMLGHVVFSLHPRKALLVVKQAVSLENGLPILKVVQAGKVHKKKVQLGKEHGDRVEIQTGLEVGDHVILQSPQYLRENESVEIEPTKEMK